MKIYAVIDNETVSNTIKADPDFVALIIPDHDDVVEITLMSRTPSIGWGYANGSFVGTPPHPSWTWNADAGDYEPPMPRPEETEE